MDFFMLNYDNNCNYVDKYDLIIKTHKENNLKQCCIIIYNHFEKINYCMFKNLIQLLVSNCVHTKINLKLVVNDAFIGSDIVDLLIRHKISVTFVFNECNLPIPEGENSCNNETIGNASKCIHNIAKSGIDFDVLVKFNDQLINRETYFCDWISNNTLDVTIVPELSTEFSTFINTSYKILQKKQHYKMFNPITNLLMKKVMENNEYFYNKDSLEKDSYYYFKDENSIYPDLGMLIEDSTFKNDVFTKYNTYGNTKLFVTARFKRDLTKVYEILQNEAVQDLRNNISNRQIAESGQAQEKERYNILFTILYRGQDHRNRVPIGLSSLASYIEQFGYSSKVLDISAHNLFKIFYNEIEAEKTKIVGFYCSNDNEFLVRNVITYLKNKYDIIALVGGPQAVALDEEFLRSTGCDIVTEGEGEGALKELMDYYIKKEGNLESIKNIKYIDENDQYHKNDKREPIQDLDALPFPKLKYDAQSESYISNLAYILTGRGCPFRCTFCYEGAHSKALRYRSMSNVFEEINRILEENPKVSFIQLYDDTFTLDHNRVLEFCDGMKKVREKRPVSWCCEAHVHTLLKNPHIIPTMIQSGLYSMQIGIESGSEKVLKAYNKNTTPEMICEIVKVCNEAKLRLLEGNIIVGGAFESKETLYESTETAKKLLRAGKGMLELFTVLYWPFPKTAISTNPDQFGMKVLDDMVAKSISSLNNAVIETTSLTREEIIQGKKDLDKVIEEEYRKLCLDLDKKQILRFWNSSKKSVIQGTKWGSYSLEYEHIRKYCMAASNNNYKFGKLTEADKIYPIRTFELLQYVDNNLCVSGIIFENIKVKVLEYSTGQYTISQIAQKLDVSVDSIVEICSELENMCFIYYSYV